MFHTPTKASILCKLAKRDDRDLDVTIARQLGYSLQFYGKSMIRYKGDGLLGPIAKWKVLPKFTDNLNDAMKLVDVRALWAHGDMEEGPFCRLCWPQPEGGYLGGYFEAHGNTVPLSICEASLAAQGL